MNQINLLVIIVCKKDFENIKIAEIPTGYIKFVPDNINIEDMMSVNSSQINLLNKALNSRTLPDVLIMCEDQLIEPAHLNKILEILYSCERHGAVVSLNGHSQGICSLAKEEYEKASKYLGDYRVIPRIESLPALIKAEMFERFGLLDEGFKSISGALSDFSLRFNEYGWSTVRANCWNDSAGVESFTENDEEIIQKKYPYIRKIEEMYYVHEEKAVEHFASVLIQEKPTLLFSLYEVPPSYNGTANYALKLFEAFWDNYHEKYNISILVKKSTDEFYGFSARYPRVYYPENVKCRIFRLGYVVSQVLFAEHMDIINKCCLKYGICMLDIICLRSHYLCKNDTGRFGLFRDSILYADLMLSISRFSHDDIASFFRDEMHDTNIRTGIIYLGTDRKMSASMPDRTAVPFETGDYFIVIGNPYRHKMIEPVLGILKEAEENFIVIGTKTEGFYQKSRRIYGYVSGWIGGTSLDGLIAESKGIIFPSVYEGFGLTLYDAAVHRKKIIVSDTQVNLELKQYLDEYGNRVITYRNQKELITILQEQDFDDDVPKDSVNLRSWEDTAKDLEAWLENMHKEETDIIRLERRWRYLKRYGSECSSHADRKKNEKKERLIRKCISSFPRMYKLYRKIVTAIDKEHYGSH